MSESQVRAILGEPTQKRRENPGQFVWIYPPQKSEGVSTITVGSGNPQRQNATVESTQYITFKDGVVIDVDYAISMQSR